MELTKSQRKTLESLGHVWTKFYQAQQMLLKRAAKGQLSDDLAPWLAFKPEFIDAKGAFEPSFVLHVQEVELADGSISYIAPYGISASDKKSFYAKGLQNGSIASVPDIMNAPVWSALLRLHELKTFWIQELRQNHYEALLQWLPESWLYTHSVLPPGTAIARLGKRDWESVIEAEIPLERIDAHSGVNAVALDAFALQNALPERHVFRRAIQMGTRELAVLYRHQNGKTQLERVQLLGA